MGNNLHLIVLSSSVELVHRFLFLKAFLLTLFHTTISHSFIHFIRTTPEHFHCALNSGHFPQSLFTQKRCLTQLSYDLSGVKSEGWWLQACPRSRLNPNGFSSLHLSRPPSIIPISARYSSAHCTWGVKEIDAFNITNVSHMCLPFLSNH